MRGRGGKKGTAEAWPLREVSESAQATTRAEVSADRKERVQGVPGADREAADMQGGADMG